MVKVTKKGRFESISECIGTGAIVLVVGLAAAGIFIYGYDAILDGQTTKGALDQILFGDNTTVIVMDRTTLMIFTMTFILLTMVAVVAGAERVYHGSRAASSNYDNGLKLTASFNSGSNGSGYLAFIDPERKCPSCGIDVGGISPKFCPECGHSFVVSAPAPKITDDFAKIL